MSGDDDYEIPESGAVFTFGRSRFAENLSSHFFVRNDPVAEISCGDDHTALVCQNGRVFLFGRNDYGQLGLGHNKTINKPSCLKYLKPFHSVHVACGKSHTIISTVCNKIFTFGCNSDGQLGIGDLTDRTVPQMIRTDFLTQDNISALSAGCHHSALLTEKGNLYMWGGNSDGQCGAKDDSYFSTPHKIEFDQPISSVSCGYYHTAFTSLGCVYTFGEEDNGKLGRLQKSSNYNPGKVEIERNCVSVKCGGSHTLVLTEDGSVYAFGSNFSGQLGIPSLEAECSTPTNVKFPEDNGNIVQMSCGESHSAFLTDKGFLYTCGDSRYGKLCNEDDSTNLMIPTLIHSLKGYLCKFVSCGGCHTMVLAKLRKINNDSDLIFSENYKYTLPPLKIKKDLEINVNNTKETKDDQENEEENEETQQKNNEYFVDSDSKSNTDSNLINNPTNSQSDDIYTEIEEFMPEKENGESKTCDFNQKNFNESQNLNSNDLVMAQKENTIKKIFKVFKRKKSESAILLNENLESKSNEEIQINNSLKTGNQNSSKTCTILVIKNLPHSTSITSLGAEQSSTTKRIPTAFEIIYLNG